MKKREDKTELYLVLVSLFGLFVVCVIFGFGIAYTAKAFFDTYLLMG